MITRRNEALEVNGIKVKKKYREDILAIIGHWGELVPGLIIETELSEIWQIVDRSETGRKVNSYMGLRSYLAKTFGVELVIWS